MGCVYHEVLNLNTPDFSFRQHSNMPPRIRTESRIMKGYFICSPLYLLTIRNTWHYFYLEYYLEFITIIPSLSHTTPIRLFPGYTRFGGHDHGCVDFGKRLWLCLKAHTSVISFISLSFPYQILPTKYGTLDT